MAELPTSAMVLMKSALASLEQKALRLVGRLWRSMVAAGAHICPLVLTLLLSGCADSSAPQALAADAPQTPPAEKPAAPVEDEPLAPLAYESALPESLRAMIGRPFTGDLDEMETRRMIRVGVTFNRTHYFVDQGTQRGLSFAYLKQFEDVLNTARKTRNFRIHVVFVPLSRDLLIPALVAGQIDAVAGQKTITSERQNVVDFSIPVRRNVSEVVVTAPGVPAVKTAKDLSGQEVFVRRSSSYYESLRTLNTQIESKGGTPVTIREAPENLEDDDLLEMVNAGLINMTVVDDYLAEFWAQIFTDMTVQKAATVRTGADLAVAFRKNSPKLEAEANAFIRSHGIGTAFGNIINRRYLENTQLARRATSGADRKQFLALIETFRKYGDRYELDYLLMMAKGYQESRLNQRVRSPVGAIGIMQIMPATGRALNVGDIQQAEPNIHAGVKYTRRLMDEYLGNEPLDDLNKGFFTLASYNAGPTRIRQLRREAARRGLDPNVWFGNVERIASERIGRETVSYVSNIFKYYIAYRLVAEEEQRRSVQRSKLKGERP
ncbi:MAG: transglycosylase SLT domain-containing protein [Gammaproteobacteria bacterium]